MFSSKWDMPAGMLVPLVVAVVFLVLLPGLRLGPIGDVVTGFIALAVAFTMLRRVEAIQAKRRALADS